MKLRRVPPPSAPLPSYPEHMMGNTAAQIDYDRRHPERNAAAYAARPDSRPKPKYQVIPDTYIPSAHLSDRELETCFLALDNYGAEAAYKAERHILGERFPSRQRPTATSTSRSWIPGTAVIALAGAAGFLGAILGGRS